MSSLGFQSKVSNLHTKGSWAAQFGQQLNAWRGAGVLERIRIVRHDQPLLHKFLNAFEGGIEWVLTIQSRDDCNSCIPTRWLPQLSALRQRLLLCI